MPLYVFVFSDVRRLRRFLRAVDRGGRIVLVAVVAELEPERVGGLSTGYAVQAVRLDEILALLEPRANS